MKFLSQIIQEANRIPPFKNGPETKNWSADNFKKIGHLNELFTWVSETVM